MKVGQLTQFTAVTAFILNGRHRAPFMPSLAASHQTDTVAAPAFFVTVHNWEIQSVRFECEMITTVPFSLAFSCKTAISRSKPLGSSAESISSQIQQANGFVALDATRSCS